MAASAADAVQCETMNEQDLNERIRKALRAVLDPEIGESIVELGLVERIEMTAPDRVDVVLIPTSATCPMADVLIEDATAAVQRVLPAGMAVEVRMDFGVAWSPARMSPLLQLRFGWQGGAA